MDIVQDLLTFIVNSPSPFHAAGTAREAFLSAGFRELTWQNPWMLERGGNYFTRIFGSSLVAFRIGKKKTRPLRIVASHTDFPALRLKSHPAITKDGYGSVNVDIYGGAILSTWFDRPLSMAGKIVLRGKDPFSPEVYYIDIARPLMTIPSLAIHLDPTVNDGRKIQRQKELLPLVALTGEDEQDGEFFEKFLQKETGTDPKKILSYDLTLYPLETPATFGMDTEFISSPRLDNLTSVKASVDGLIDGDFDEGLFMNILFDHEEVGSHTKGGADSVLLMQALERIYRGLELDADDLAKDIAEGFLLSLDVAHGMHPSHSEKSDPTNRPILGKGIVIKQAANQNYVGDAEARAIIRALCEEREIPYQYYSNSMDIKGGSTLGSHASAGLSMRALDVGVPILAMHSARETMAGKDETALTSLVVSFFSN